MAFCYDWRRVDGVFAVVLVAAPEGFGARVSRWRCAALVREQQGLELVRGPAAPGKLQRSASGMCLA